MTRTQTEIRLDWEAFRDSGLLWWTNRTLHHRGFPNTDEAINVNTLTNYIKNNQ